MWEKLKIKHLHLSRKRVFKLGSQVKTNLQKEKKTEGKSLSGRSQRRCWGRFMLTWLLEERAEKCILKLTQKIWTRQKKRSDPNQSSKLEKNDQRLHPYALENGQLLMFICQQMRAWLYSLTTVQPQFKREIVKLFQHRLFHQRFETDEISSSYNFRQSPC